MALITQANIEAMLQVTFDNPADPTVAQYIDEAQAIADAYCGQPLEDDGADVVETFEGIQGPYHFTQRHPLSAVSSVVENGNTLTHPDEYRWYTDGSMRRVAGQFDSEWSRLVDANVATYRAGYSLTIGAPVLAPPADLVRAITAIAAGFFKVGAQYAAQGAVPIKSVALDGSDTITYAVADLDKSMQPVEVVNNQGKQLFAPYVLRVL